MKDSEPVVYVTFETADADGKLTIAEAPSDLLPQQNLFVNSHAEYPSLDFGWKATGFDTSFDTTTVISGTSSYRFLAVATNMAYLIHSDEVIIVPNSRYCLSHIQTSLCNPNFN